MWYIVDLEKGEVVYMNNDYDLTKKVLETQYLDGIDYHEIDRYVIIYNPFQSRRKQVKTTCFSNRYMI